MASHLASRLCPALPIQFRLQGCCRQLLHDIQGLLPNLFAMLCRELLFIPNSYFFFFASELPTKHRVLLCTGFPGPRCSRSPLIELFQCPRPLDETTDSRPSSPKQSRAKTHTIRG
jgi:hypothetical protein